LRTYFFFNKADLFVPAGDGRFRHLRAGLHYPFRERVYKLKETVFVLPARAYDEAYFYIRLESQLRTGFGLSLVPLPELFNNSLKDYSYYGFLGGILFLTLLLNLLLFLIAKEIIYLYYSLYVICFGLFLAVDLGFVKQLTGIDYLPWNYIYWTVPFAGMTVFLLLYIRAFLNAPRYLPVLGKVIGWMIAVRLVILAIGYAFAIEFLHDPYLDNAMLLVAYAGVWVRYRRGFRPARYLLTGLSIIFLGFIFHNLYIIRGFSDAQYFFYNLGIAEIIFFSGALADRFRRVKAENEAAQRQIIAQLRENEETKDRINRELEAMVRERTQEIARVNQLLQQHNQTLIEEVVDISKARVTQKAMTFEEFQKIFPDEEACLRYLEDLKWHDGFACKKCGHPRFSPGAEPYVRRCSSCRYAESVTSGTLFSRLRFPIVKAFYLLFLVSNGTEGTTDELSEKLDLRRQTCWTFTRKVKEAMEARKGRRRNKDRWSHLILD
ncbi:MAG TPA: 7TM diverse intracellular signaling domain-containing protein, partial [Cytophagales bacterium]